jgi:hypothetical protein
LGLYPLSSLSLSLRPKESSSLLNAIFLSMSSVVQKDALS